MKTSKTKVDQQQVVSCKGAKTRGWYAWLDTMPPKPDAFHVNGEVQVGNPGIYALLLKKEPQGINPAIVLLGPSPRSASRHLATGRFVGCS